MPAWPEQFRRRQQIEQRDLVDRALFPESCASISAPANVLTAPGSAPNIAASKTIRARQDSTSGNSDSPSVPPSITRTSSLVWRKLVGRVNAGAVVLHQDIANSEDENGMRHGYAYPLKSGCDDMLRLFRSPRLDLD